MSLLSSLALEILGLALLGVVFFYYGKRKIIRKFMEEGAALKEEIRREALDKNISQEKLDRFFLGPHQQHLPIDKELIKLYQSWFEEKKKANL